MPQLPNPKHELFAQQRAQGRTVDEAYGLAGYKPNRGNAGRLNANEGVQARIAELQAKGAEKAEITVAGVLMELWRIATADPGELVEHRVGCCRYCWGKGYRYQETVREQDRRRREWERARIEAAGQEDTSGLVDLDAFDQLGGIGFNALRDPNPACPECWGQGVGLPVFKDTRKLSPAAKALYAGVKVTKDGLEVKMHDKVGALTKVGQHLGMFVERRVNTNVSVEDFLEQLDRAGEPGAAET